MMQPYRFKSLAAPLLLALACAGSWLHQATYDFQHDDAYITYRYARNWAEGHGPVYNLGERVEGYSNFLLMATLAAVHKAGGDIVNTARDAGTLACWLLVVLSFACMRVLLRRDVSLAVAAALGVALHAGLSTWARSGLETLPFATGVLLAQSAFLWEHLRARRHWVSGALFGLVALSRADGILYVGFTALFLLLVRRPRSLVTLLVPFAFFYAPYFMWRFTYYGGYALPNSYYAKIGGDIYQQLRGLFYAYNFVTSFGGMLLFALPLALFALRDPRRDAQRLYLGVCTLGISAYVVWAGGDHMPMFRFFMPIAVPLLILCLEAAVEIAPRLAAGRRAQGVAMATMIGLVLLAGFAPTLNQRRLPYTHAVAGRTYVQQWRLAGEYFRHTLRPDAVLATAAAGSMAYHSQLFTIDMLGINDLHIAHTPAPAMGHGRAGHERGDFAYVLSRRPDVIFRGVRVERADAGTRTHYPNGADYVLRCAALGNGPLAEEFGNVVEQPLYVWYEALADSEPDVQQHP